MRGSWVVALKEMRTYLVSPIVYVVFLVFFGVSGFLFVSAMEYFALQCFQFLGYGATLNLTRYVYSTQFHNMSILLLFMTPALTMRVFSEERKQNTIELLYTSPITSFQLVAGKLIGVFSVVSFMLIVTLYMPVMGEWLSSLDWGRVLTSYIGLFLLSISFISIGFFSSSLTENQIVAASVSFGISLLFWVMDWMGANVGGKLGYLLFNLSIPSHLRPFINGLLDTKDIVFFLSFSFFFLYLSWILIERDRLK